VSSIKKKLILGSAWALSGRIFMVAFALALNGILARLLSPEDMGVYFISLTIVATVAAVAPLGMNQAVVRLVAESIAKQSFEEARGAVLLTIKTVLACSVMLSILFYAGIGEWLAVDVFKTLTIKSLLILIAIWIIARSLQDTIAECFRGFHAIGMATLFGGLLSSALSLFFCTIVWWLYEDISLPLMIGCIVAAIVGNVLLSTIFLYQRLPKNIQSKQLHARGVFHISLPLWGSGLLLMLMAQLDIWVLGIVSNETDVALYGAAVKLVMLVSMPLMIINAVVPPLIAELHAKGELTTLEKTLRMVATVAGIPAFGVLLIFMLWGDVFLGLVYGDYYKDAALLLAILCVGQFVAVFGGACGYTLSMTGHQKSLLIIMSVTTLITLVSIVPMANYFGVIGVAIMTSSWQVLLHMTALFITRKKVGVWTHIEWNLFAVAKSIRQAGKFKVENKY